MVRTWWLTEEENDKFVSVHDVSSRKTSKLINKKTGEPFEAVKDCHEYSNTHVKFVFNGSNGKDEAYLLKRDKFEWNRSAFSKNFRECSSVQEFVDVFHNLRGQTSQPSIDEEDMSFSSDEPSLSLLSTMEESDEDMSTSYSSSDSLNSNISKSRTRKETKKRIMKDLEVSSVGLKKKAKKSPESCMNQEQFAEEISAAYCGMFKLDIEALNLKENVRQCDQVFLDNLKKEMEVFADEAYQPLCVVAEGVHSPADFNCKKVNGYTYSVIGGQHCLSAIKSIRKMEKYSGDSRFHTRNCVVYATLSKEKEQWLAVKHNLTGDYRHSTTLKDKVHVCRKLKSSDTEGKKRQWKETCAIVLNEKKGSQLLEVVCFLAALDDTCSKLLDEIFEMNERQCLKNQKSKVDKAKPDIAPYIFRPLRSIDAQTTQSLLVDVQNRQFSLAEMHKEAQLLSKLQAVQKSLIQITGVDSWEEALRHFPDATKRENLIRFTKLSFRPTIPDAFVNYCQRLRAEEDSAGGKKMYQAGEAKAILTKGDVLECSPEYLQEVTGTGTCLDVIFLHMPESWEDQELKNFIVTIKNINSCGKLREYTIVIFTEIDKINIIKDLLRGAGCAKIDMAFYHIEDQDTDSTTLTDSVKPMVIGYWSQNGVVLNRINGSRSNLFKTNKTKPLKDEDGNIMNRIKKPQDMMCPLIERFSHQNQWILDACCGTGSGVRAGMLLKRNCIGIEISSQKVDYGLILCDMQTQGHDDDSEF